MHPARGFWVPALALALLAGCVTDSGEYTANVSQNYPVPEQASPQCVAAAQSASRWCKGKGRTAVGDDLNSFECTRAQWDYARDCR